MDLYLFELVLQCALNIGVTLLLVKVRLFVKILCSKHLLTHWVKSSRITVFTHLTPFIVISLNWRFWFKLEEMISLTSPADVSYR